MTTTTTTTVPTAAGYIATDSNHVAIHGVGDTAEAAILDGRTESGDAEAEYVTVPASAALLAKVREIGGMVNWTVLGNASGEPVGNGWASYESATAVLDSEID